MEPSPSALPEPLPVDAPVPRVAALPRLLPRRLVALLKAEERPLTPPPAVELTCPVLLTLLEELEGREFDCTV